MCTAVSETECLMDIQWPVWPGPRIAAAFEEVDATPMEGFDPAKVDEILDLRAKGLRSVTLMPLGYRAAEGDWLNGATKVRKPMDELVTLVA